MLRLAYYRRRTTAGTTATGGPQPGRYRGSAEAPAVAVICGGEPITRVEVAGAGRRPALVDAVLAAVGV